MIRRLTRLLVALGAALVPSERRADWLEEWWAEIEALDDARRSGVVGLPGRLAFVAGSLPHALWMRREGWTMDSVFLDLRYAVRVLRRAPGFTTVAALTLALGIGANASIFSLVNGLVLRAPAGLDRPERLVQIARSYEDAPRWDNFSWPALVLIRDQTRTLSGVAGYSSEAFVLGQGEGTERVIGALVTGDYFDVLGVPPHTGRLIQPQDDIEAGAHPVVVLSHALWVRRYAADPRIVGSTVQIGAEPYEVIGVTPAGFAGVESVGARPSVFVPTMQHPGFGGRLPFGEWGSSWISVIGRLHDDVSFEEAKASMPVVSSRLRDAAPVNENILVLLAEGVGLDPEGRIEARQISMILLLIVGLVLLITCTNVANLLLARASGRHREVGVRMAMGAGRVRVVRQLVTESALLAALATFLAIPMVFVAGDLLPALFPYALAVSVQADARVYGFLLATGLLAGLLFGVAPAWAVSRRDILCALRGGAATGGQAGARLRDGLVVSQLALSLGLVAGAALLGRSVLNARSAEPGFQPEGVVATYVDLYTTGRYEAERGQSFLRALHDEATNQPGVRSATLANQLPIAGGHSRASVGPAGREDMTFEAEYIVVGPDYFETLGIPLVRGRALRGFDDEPERVVVVNERLAAMFWPNEDPIGQEIERDGSWRVVGVAGDVQMRSLRARANPAVYYPAAQVYSPFMVLQVAGEAGVEVDPITLRRAVAAVDAELPVTTIVDLQAAVAASMGETRTIGYLVGAFAGLALALAVVGLYGLVSYGASQRVREIGIRIALGARPDSLVRLILAKGMGIALLGVTLGFVMAWGLGSALRGLLFGVGHMDVPTLVGAAWLLLAVAGVASWLPARRASRADASISLRDS
jgi:putative ABC transport system permease protein